MGGFRGFHGPPTPASYIVDAQCNGNGFETMGSQKVNGSESTSGHNVNHHVKVAWPLDGLFSLPSVVHESLMGSLETRSHRGATSCLSPGLPNFGMEFFLMFQEKIGMSFNSFQEVEL